MATRGTVFTLANNKVVGIYNHFDSYPSELGRILKEHYNSYEDVLDLISHGDSSYIGRTIEDSKFYSSDGEPIVPCRAQSVDQFIIHHGQEYNYFFDPLTNEWKTY